MMDHSKGKIILPEAYKVVLLESVEDQMYKVSLLLDKHKGRPLTKERRMLTKKQAVLEELQHIIHSNS